MVSWIDVELASLNFGDARRTRRARQMIRRMADRPTGSIPRTFNGAAEAKAAYRFLANPDVDPEALRGAATEACAKRLRKEKRVFVVQDTTSLGFSRRKAVEGLGPPGGGDGSGGHGMFVHSALAVSEEGIPLGLLHQKTLSRDPDKIGGAGDRREMPIESKESFRSIETREAELVVRFQKLTVQVPSHGVHAPDLEPVELTAILAQELSPPPKATAVRWLLLTDLPVQSFEDARECGRHYSLRWLIERYHYVLKSGCGIEESQLRSAAALDRLLALYCVVALRLLWLTHSARHEGDAPCTVAFTDVEWQTLCRYRDPSATPPKVPPRLRDMVRWTAQLGGFLARVSDGEPGVKTLWPGLMRLQDIVIGVRLLTPLDVGNA